MIRARRAQDGGTAYQLVVYAGRNGRGDDEYVRRTLRGVSRREANRPDRFTYDWVCVDKAVDDGAHVRLHDLRHFHGTMLVGAGVPLPSVRDRLGHSSVTVTDIYVDGRSEWDQRSAEIMGAVLDSGTLSGPSH